MMPGIDLGDFINSNIIVRGTTLLAIDMPKLVGGVILRPLIRHKDSRGSLIELVKEYSDCTMVYTSKTYLMQARDEDRWHLHKIQTDRFSFLHGSCIFAISDGKSTQRIRIFAEDDVQLIIPPGTYHAFLAYTESFILVNVPTHLYNPNDELRVPFGDIEAEAPWIPVKS